MNSYIVILKDGSVSFYKASDLSNLSYELRLAFIEQYDILSITFI